MPADASKKAIGNSIYCQFIGFQIITILVASTHQQERIVTLGVDCGHDMECSDHIKDSYCSMQNKCECSPFYVEFNNTLCLQCEFQSLYIFYCCVSMCWYNSNSKSSYSTTFGKWLHEKWTMLNESGEQWMSWWSVQMCRRLSSIQKAHVSCS